MYLLNPKKNKSVAHLWDGNDTVCTMYSTNGLRKKKQILSETTMGKRICVMCRTVNNNSPNPLPVKDEEYDKDKEQFTLFLPNV